MSIFDRTFSTGEVIATSGITNPALQTWINRGKIVGHGEGGDMPGRPGIRRAFSIYSVMQIATAAALSRAGLAGIDVFSAAREFSHLGTGGRFAGLPFPGRIGTILAVSGDRSEVLPWKRGADQGLGEDPYTLARNAFGGLAAIILLDVEEVFRRVVSDLKEDPGAVLKMAYGDGPFDPADFDMSGDQVA
jgi:hypothetical protein